MVGHCLRACGEDDSPKHTKHGARGGSERGPHPRRTPGKARAVQLHLAVGGAVPMPEAPDFAVDDAPLNRCAAGLD